SRPPGQQLQTPASQPAGKTPASTPASVPASITLGAAMGIAGGVVGNVGGACVTGGALGGGAGSSGPSFCTNAKPSSTPRIASENSPASVVERRGPRSRAAAPMSAAAGLGELARAPASEGELAPAPAGVGEGRAIGATAVGAPGSTDRECSRVRPTIAAGDATAVGRAPPPIDAGCTTTGAPLPACQRAASSLPLCRRSAGRSARHSANRRSHSSSGLPGNAALDST